MINKIKMLYDIYFSRINVDRQLQHADLTLLHRATLAGSMWTGNYNGDACRLVTA